MKRSKIVATAVASAVLATAIMATSALAAPPTPPATTTPGATMPCGGGMMGMRGQPTWAGFEQEVAAFLGMTQEQVQAERLAGKPLVQIAQAKGKTEQELISVILAAKKADLDKAVADQVITQAQADLMYEHMQQQVPQMVNRTTTGPAFRQGGGMMNPGMGNPGTGPGRGRGMGMRWN
jgi:hypothetical protein